MPSYNLERPVDQRGGQPPALPLKHRLEFVNDVRGTAETPPMTRKQILAKWKDYKRAKVKLSERVADEWTKWAKQLTPIDPPVYSEAAGLLLAQVDASPQAVRLEASPLIDELLAAGCLSSLGNDLYVSTITGKAALSK